MKIGSSAVPLERHISPVPSEAGRQRLLATPGEPLFLADWKHVLMVHYEVAAKALQPIVPFELDLVDGRAFISLVAFTMRGMRLRRGGCFGEWLLKPIATHEYLNVRTYVRHGSETGIYFLAEWLPNRLSLALGPRFFGLPYRLGAFNYHQLGRSILEAHVAEGSVRDGAGKGVLDFKVTPQQNTEPQNCQPGSLDEWLMERYTAFTDANGKQRFFRVWHEPWMRMPASVQIGQQSLLDLNWPFFQKATILGASLSPGVEAVWMGRPRSVSTL